VLHHPWSITDEDPPNREDADHHLRHTGVVEELISLWTVVSSVVDRVRECLPGEASQVEVMGKLATKF
jgi:hypothetical protein